jgi:hypothetical protein
MQDAQACGIGKRLEDGINVSFWHAALAIVTGKWRVRKVLK